MKAIHIIVDGSGSSSTLGKASALDLLVAAAWRQAVWRGGEPHLSVWQETVTPIDRAAWAETTLAGRADMGALAAFLTALPAGEAALVLTDGVWREEAGDVLSEAVREMAAELVFVAVGADADRDALAEIALTYAAEDVVTALRALLDASSEP